MVKLQLWLNKTFSDKALNSGPCHFCAEAESRRNKAKEDASAILKNSILRLPVYFVQWCLCSISFGTVLALFSLLSLLFLPCRGAAAQTVPAADHHAHLQSEAAARLLNETSKLHADEASPEKEKPYTAKDLISALDAAGIERAT